MARMGHFPVKRRVAEPPVLKGKKGELFANVFLSA